MHLYYMSKGIVEADRHGELLLSKGKPTKVECSFIDFVDNYTPIGNCFVGLPQLGLQIGFWNVEGSPKVQQDSPQNKLLCLIRALENGNNLFSLGNCLH